MSRTSYPTPSGATRPRAVGSPTSGRTEREGVTGCRIIELPRHADPRGNLTFIEGGQTSRSRSSGSTTSTTSRAARPRRPRAQAAPAADHRRVRQLRRRRSTTAPSRERFHLNRSYYGLYMPPMIWRELDNFSSGSRLPGARVAPTTTRSDYYRDYDEFTAARERMSVPFLDLAARDPRARGRARRRHRARARSRLVRARRRRSSASRRRGPPTAAPRTASAVGTAWTRCASRCGARRRRRATR